MTPDKDYTVDSGGGASSELGDNRAAPGHSAIDKLLSPDRPARRVFNSIHSTPWTTPEKSEITRSSSYTTKMRRTNRCYQEQKRSSEDLVDAVQGRESQKRRIISEGKDSADEDTHGAQSTQLLACPFSKLDGNRYYGCLKFELRRVKDVKQHISRKHLSPEFYCARCWQTFPDRGRQDEHVRVALCAIQPKPLFEGISDEKKDQLKRSGDRGATLEQQWYNVWDILFPEKQRPSSIYLGNFMEETLSYIRNRWQDEDLETISNTLRKRRGEPVDAGLVKDVVTVVLDCFHGIVDNTPGGCEFGPVETDTLSQSDTSSSSASISDLDFLHEGVNLECSWPFPELSSMYDFEPGGLAMPGTPYHGFNEGWHLGHVCT